MTAESLQIFLKKAKTYGDVVNEFSQGANE